MERCVERERDCLKDPVWARELQATQRALIMLHTSLLFVQGWNDALSGNALKKVTYQIYSKKTNKPETTIYSHIFV